MPAHLHEKVCCSDCKTMIRQCRCPGPHPVRYEVCATCRILRDRRAPASRGRRFDARRGLFTLVFSVALALGLQGCPPPRSPNPIYTDDKETSEEAAQAKGKTACQRAADRLKVLHCKESADDFAQRCQELVDAKQPICPTKLSRIKACSEVDEVCR